MNQDEQEICHPCENKSSEEDEIEEGLLSLEQEFRDAISKKEEKIAEN